MVKRLEKETDELMRILEEASAAERLAQQKEEAKVWGRSIPMSRSLLDFLLKLTKDEMQEIAGAQALNNFKSLKKQELAEYLCAPILKAAEQLFGVLDQEQCEFFSDLCDQQGLCTDMTAVSSSLPYFLDQGLVFPGTVKKQRVVALPAEIMASFKKMASPKLQQKAARNTKWIQLAGGVLFYYGVQTLSQLADHMNKLNEEKVNEAELGEVLRCNAVFTSDTIREDSGIFCNIRVFDYEKVLAEQSMRPDLWFYPITYEQAMAAGAQDFVERTPAFNVFSEFLQEKYKAGANEADEILAECAFAFRLGESIGSVVEYLAGMIDIKGARDLKEVTAKVVEMANTTRQWGLKGYAPVEVRKAHSNLSNVLMPESPGDIENLDFSGKPGRNEPCPCGSGKKFKKCCGRLV
ncbi:MAG: SEC-C domain-containing protein [Pelosinus sp.]|nr:SEC-C domain-containing protein [Pelosinus sp.]